jgi:eukaryotic-like serine/threonine-protein kinase
VTQPHGLAGSPKTAEAERAAIEAVRRCPTCQQHFSGDARFCPFDGDPLVVAEGYRPESDPLLGKLIEGRYEVESVLGEGGMGSVYAVRHRALDKRFAMKVMRADLAKQGELAARFIQEARATGAIGHPNIVQITDFGQLPSGAPYFVMELLDGTPLSKLIRKGGPLPARLAVRVLIQTASALSAAHAAGVIHRDLKPDNIHITKNDTVKILDFGVAKMAGAGRLTRTGMVFGTPHYMSPEQASGAEVDHRADMYALGIIMYEMFTGKVPFEADSYMGVLTKHMFMDPEPPSHVNEAARELGALEDVTLRCLEKRPEARYASMDELVADIQSIVHFDGDKLEIVRPSSHYRRASLPAGLADELEPPAKEELRESLRAAGVPVGVPPVVWALGILAGAGAFVAIVYALARPSADAVSTQAPTLVSPVPSSAPLAPSAVAPVDRPAPSAEPPGDAPDITPPLDKPAVAVAPKPRRKAEPLRPAPAPKPTSPHTQFGTGEIVNPWAR